jgi:phytoene desaturase (3,4-didehydrolycopene-forming)
MRAGFDADRTVLLAVRLDLQSIWSRVSRFFETERLRRAFSFSSMYMGMSFVSLLLPFLLCLPATQADNPLTLDSRRPFEAPGTYSLLQYTEVRVSPS